MTYARLCFTLGLGMLMATVALVLLSMAAGHVLPYMGDLAYITTPQGVNRLAIMDVQRQFSVLMKGFFINDCCLTWSPDGQNLTYVVDMSSDGSTDIFSADFRHPAQRLTTASGADLYPAYSPDGTLMAYASFGTGTPEIILMNRDGSQSRSLTGRQRIVNLNPHPVWSADGQSVLFSDFNQPTALLAVPGTCADPCDRTIQPVYAIHGQPLMTTSFIPLDSSRMLLAAFDRTQRGGYGVYVLDTRAAGAPERLTTNFGLAAPSVAVYDHWIAFASGNTDPQQPVTQSSLYVLDANCIGTAAGCAGSLQKVADHLAAEDNLSWSPDGRWLAYVTAANGRSYLRLLDATCISAHLDCAAYSHALPVTSRRYMRPAWRPPR